MFDSIAWSESARSFVNKRILYLVIDQRVKVVSFTETGSAAQINCLEQRRLPTNWRPTWGCFCTVSSVYCFTLLFNSSAEYVWKYIADCCNTCDEYDQRHFRCAKSTECTRCSQAKEIVESHWKIVAERAWEKVSDTYLTDGRRPERGQTITSRAAVVALTVGLSRYGGRRFRCFRGRMPGRRSSSQQTVGFSRRPGEPPREV
jgi:hypothetical protein